MSEPGKPTLPELSDKLYDYQKDGIKWLWDIYHDDKKKGAILGDDMGLGKTIQTSYLLSLLSAACSGNIRCILVCPMSVMANWMEEMDKWCPDVEVRLFHGGSVRARNEIMRTVVQCGGILLTSYGTLLSSIHDMPQDIEWDMVICDEGHKLKSHTSKTSKALRLIKSRKRILLTGTPIQNNLIEMWSLFDFVCDGGLLGSLTDFNEEYNMVIVASQDRLASKRDKERGVEMTTLLYSTIEPYFLRREKQHVLVHTEGRINNALGNGGREMKKKMDVVLWTYLSDWQIMLYRNFLDSEAVSMVKS